MKSYTHYCKDCQRAIKGPLVLLTGCYYCGSQDTELVEEEDVEW